MRRAAIGAIAAVIVVLLGAAVGSSVPLPPRAPVYIDDATRSYLAAPCKNGGLHDSEIDPDKLRPGTAREARELRYKPDRTCRAAGLHAPDGRSLLGKGLEWVGFLPPLHQWWDDW